MSHGTIELTFCMRNAESQLLFSSDNPHWDFDLPSDFDDRPVLGEKPKRDTLGGNAMRVFNMQLPAGKLTQMA